MRSGLRCGISVMHISTGSKTKVRRLEDRVLGYMGGRGRV